MGFILAVYMVRILLTPGFTVFYIYIPFMLLLTGVRKAASLLFLT